jgi:hypothetical protein
MAFPGTQTAGHTNFVIFTSWNSPMVQPTITDDAGNTYTLISTTSGPQGLWESLFGAFNIKTSAAGNQIYSNVTTNENFQCVEYKGVINVQDGAAHFDSALYDPGPISTSALATSNPQDFVLVFASSVNALNYTPGTGYTSRILTSHQFLQDQITTTIGTFSGNATFTGGPSTWLAMTIAFESMQVQTQ